LDARTESEKEKDLKEYEEKLRREGSGFSGLEDVSGDKKPHQSLAQDGKSAGAFGDPKSYQGLFA
jgi:hypothetical protein